MNRIILSTILSLAFASMLFAQSWQKITIDPNIDGPVSVYATDINDDGRVDIVGAAELTDAIAWYRQELDGTFTKLIIDPNFNGARSVYATDINDDGRVDVVGAANVADTIAWYRQELDGTFTKLIIDPNFDGVYSVYATDINDDGRVDVVGAGTTADDICWYRQELDGTFYKLIIDPNVGGARSVYAIDIDDDGRVDVVGAAAVTDDIYWWKNVPETYDDVAVDSIALPDSVLEGTLLHPVARVKNLGDCVQTFRVYCTINPGAYDTSSMVTALDPGESQMIMFTPRFSFTSLGFCTVTVYTQLAGDINPSNDTLKKVIWVIEEQLDVATDSIALSDSLDVDTPFLPRARVKNLGNTIQSFNVKCTITPGEYDTTAQITALKPDSSKLFYFNKYFTFPDTGYYTVTVYTQLVGDINPTNDTLEKVIYAEETVCDVGPISIDISDTLPLGTTLQPQAYVKNFGDYTETFIVTCEIEPGEYTKTQTVNNLASGDSTQVTFFTQFIFEELGSYVVTVYTRLDIDEVPENDTLVKIITTTGINEDDSGIPESFMFSVPTINKRHTEVLLALPSATTIDLLVYDAAGRLCKTLISERFSAGTYNIPITLHLPTGVYFYNLKTESGRNIVKKFVVVE